MFPLCRQFPACDEWWTGILGEVSDNDPIDELSRLFRSLADTDFQGYSPIYERLAIAIASDRDVLGFILASAGIDARRGRVPVLFFAATHDVVLSRPDSPLARIYQGELDDDPVPAFLSMLDDERDAIAERMRTRSVQTNEVGRSAAIAAAVAAATSDDSRPVALVEIGPSAGLNLYFDRYLIDFRRGTRVVDSTGPTDSPVHIPCELRGDLDPPPHGSLGTIAIRTGIDAAPIDITDPSQSRWLRACLWPGIPDRPERLVAAIDLVRSTPPSLVRGDAIVGLPSLVASIAEPMVPVVIATWALAYMSGEGRQQILDDLDAIGMQRDLAFVTLEEPRFTPWNPDVPDRGKATATGDGTTTLLAVRRWRNGECESRPLAFVHPHGRWMQWIDAPTTTTNGDENG